MNKIFTLSNKVKIAIPGNVTPIFFEDGFYIDKWISENEDFLIQGSVKTFVQLNDKTIIIDTISIDIADWVKKEIDYFVEQIRHNNLNLILGNISNIHWIYHYLKINYNDIDVYCPEIIDRENNIDIARLNIFLKYEPNTIYL